MVTILNDVSPVVAGFHLTGKITHHDYQHVVIPKVDAVAAATDQVRFLLILETTLGQFDLRAVWDDVSVGLKHLRQWHKTAIVSDEKAAQRLTDTIGQLIPGEVRSFTLAEAEEAKRWVAE